MSKGSTPYESSQRVWDGGNRQDSMAGMGLREQSEQKYALAEFLVADAVSSRYRGMILKRFCIYEFEHDWWRIFPVLEISVF